MRFPLLLAVPVLLSSCDLLPSQPPSLSQSQAKRLPIELEGGHIYLQASLNSAPPEWFILDSGSTHTLIGQSQAQSLGLKPQSSVQIKGVGDRKISATSSSGAAFDLSGINWNSSELLVVSPSFFAPLQQYFGREFSGIIGADLFEQFVVEVDYAEQTLRLSDSKTYRYRGDGYKIPLKLRKGKPYVEGVLQPASGQPIESQLLVDLGSGAALDINEPVSPKVHQWLSQTPSLPRLTLGVGGEKAVRIGRIQQLQMGDLKVKQPITEFSLEHPPRPQQKLSGRIGSQILSPFRITLDYGRKHMILEPQAQPPPINYDMSGLWLKTQGRPFDQIWVERVFENSPAAEADIRAGDRILSIDRQPVSELSLNQVRQRLKITGQTVQLQIQRQQQTLPVQLTLKSLI